MQAQIWYHCLPFAKQSLRIFPASLYIVMQTENQKHKRTYFLQSANRAIVHTCKYLSAYLQGNQRCHFIFLKVRNNRTSVARTLMARGGWVVQWCWINFKLPVSGRPTNLENSRARPYYACIRVGVLCFGRFFLICHLSLSLSLSGRRPDTDWNTI